MWAFLILVAFLLNFTSQVIKNEKQMIQGLKFLNQINGNEIPGLIKVGFMDNSRGKNCRGNIFDLRPNVSGSAITRLNSNKDLCRNPHKLIDNDVDFPTPRSEFQSFQADSMNLCSMN
jgi:hypothetical protein